MPDWLQLIARKALAMVTINPHRAGLVFALFGGGWHLLWSLLVASGWAQTVMDFILWMHFIKPVFAIEAFGVGRAAILVAVTATIGYAVGYSLGVLWNWTQRHPDTSSLSIERRRRSAAE